jgi:CheY-like chemotaxis protein
VASTAQVSVNQKVILRLLQRLGYHAEVANNGSEVLKMLTWF